MKKVPRAHWRHDVPRPWEHRHGASGEFKRHLGDTNRRGCWLAVVVGYGDHHAAEWMVALTAKTGSRERRLHRVSDVEFRFTLGGGRDLESIKGPSVCKPCWCQTNKISFLWFLQLGQKNYFTQWKLLLKWNSYAEVLPILFLLLSFEVWELERFEEVWFHCQNASALSLLITFCKMQKTHVDLQIKKKDKQKQLSTHTLFAYLGR